MSRTMKIIRCEFRNGVKAKGTLFGSIEEFRFGACLPRTCGKGNCYPEFQILNIPNAPYHHSALSENPKSSFHDVRSKWTRPLLSKPIMITFGPTKLLELIQEDAKFNVNITYYCEESRNLKKRSFWKRRAPYNT